MDTRPTRRKLPIRKKADGAYHHGDLKAALKQAALRLVQEKGPRGFSLNEASRLAGVTVAAPYRHFADKDALLAELARDGHDLLTRELREATAGVSGPPEQMLAAGMAYLRFSRFHAAYFAVIFSAGLRKALYPELERAARASFGVLLEIAHQFEPTPELALQRAVSAWALVHGLATLSIDEVLPQISASSGFEPLRPLLAHFLSQPFR